MSSKGLLVSFVCVAAFTILYFVNRSQTSDFFLHGFDRDGDHQEQIVDSFSSQDISSSSSFQSQDRLEINAYFEGREYPPLGLIVGPELIQNSKTKQTVRSKKLFKRNIPPPDTDDVNLEKYNLPFNIIIFYVYFFS
jgi:hypothetical protein